MFPGYPGTLDLRQVQSARSNVPLITSRTVSFDTGRNAIAIMGPERAAQKWHVTRMVTNAGLSNDFITLIVYRNFATPTNILDSTKAGVQATSETDLNLLEGEKMIFAWAGGTPNTPAIMIVNGEIYY